VVDGPDAGRLPPESVVDPCGRAQVAFDEGAFRDAVTLLREQSVLEPDFGARPETDLCLSRALLGEGAAAEALGLAGALAEDPTLPTAQRRRACVLAVWSALRADQTRAAVATLRSCESGADAPLGAEDTLRADDTDAARAVLATARAEAGDLPAAITTASALLGAAEPTREWAVRSALGWALDLDGAAIERLARAARSGDDLSAAALTVAELHAAIEARDDSAASRLRALAEEQLAALASPAADELLADLAAPGDDEARPALFGAVVPSRGAGRAEARATLAGLLLAQRAFQPGYEPFARLLVRETGDDETEVRTAVVELAEQGVIALVAPTDPRVAAWVVAGAEQLGVPVLSLGSAPPLGAQWTFGFLADPRAEAQALVEYCAVRGIGSVAIAMPERPAPHLEAVAQAFAELGRAQHIAVDEPLRYWGDDLQRELSDLAERLARRDFDALLVADGGANASTLAAYLAVENVWAGDPLSGAGSGRRLVQYLGTSAWEDTSFLDAGPDYLVGGVFPAWHTGSAEAERFVAEFAWVYGRDPGLADALAYDAMTVLRALVLDYGASSRAGLRDALIGGSGLVGATGALDFGAERRRGLQPQLMRVTSGAGGGGAQP
jgi:ABC-type branched-subunit amino acid transport system substrate-binding protein